MLIPLPKIIICGKGKLTLKAGCSPKISLCPFNDDDKATVNVIRQELKDIWTRIKTLWLNVARQLKHTEHFVFCLREQLEMNQTAISAFTNFWMTSGARGLRAASRTLWSAERTCTTTTRRSPPCPRCTRPARSCSVSSVSVVISFRSLWRRSCLNVCGTRCLALEDASVRCRNQASIATIF